MGQPEAIPPNPNPISPSTTPPALLEPPPQRQHGGGLLKFPRPALRVTSEFDSETEVWFHKVSCRLFDRLAKLKLSFQNDQRGQVSSPQIGFLAKNLSIIYDVESQNALLKGSLDLAGCLQLRATHDVKRGQIGESNYVRLGCSMKTLSFSCSCESNKSILSCINLARILLFKFHYKKHVFLRGQVILLHPLTEDGLSQDGNEIDEMGLA